MRGATQPLARPLVAPAISTHAPRAGSDIPVFFCLIANTHFNPRSPCGERLSCVLTSFSATRFQPTLPVRGATRGGPGTSTSTTNFNPRSPCGERHQSGSHSAPCFVNFNPRSPCGERRRNFIPLYTTCCDFNPRSPCGERPPVPPVL